MRDVAKLGGNGGCGGMVSAFLIAVILVGLVCVFWEPASAASGLDQPITVGMVMWPLLGIAGVVVVLGVLFFILSVIAKGFEH